jgi:hypothetical protein
VTGNGIIVSKGVAMPSRRRRMSLLIAGAILASCSEAERQGDGEANPEPPQVAGAVPTECDDGARATAEQLGERLRLVSTLAPESIAAAAIDARYADLVTPELLERWTVDPASAPGRNVSSPWPERIDIRSAEATTDGCRIKGEVVFVTSVDSAGGAEALHEEVIIHLIRNGGWRIRDYAPVDADVGNRAPTP